MINKGDTIVYHADHGLMFYWLCDIRPDGYVFFNWYADPYRATSTDFWKMSKEWFEEKVKADKIEVFDSLPEKYMDIFSQQAAERNN